MHMYRVVHNNHLKWIEKTLQPSHSRDTPLTSKQSLFLSNAMNKSRLIRLLSQKLEENEIKSLVANADAESLVIHTAICCSEMNELAKMWI